MMMPILASVLSEGLLPSEGGGLFDCDGDGGGVGHGEAAEQASEIDDHCTPTRVRLVALLLAPASPRNAVDAPTIDAIGIDSTPFTAADGILALDGSRRYAESVLLWLS